MNNASINILEFVLWSTYEGSSVAYTSRNGIFGYVCLILQKIAKQFFRVTVSLYIPTGSV